jgi:hypothetical protein
LTDAVSSNAKVVFYSSYYFILKLNLEQSKAASFSIPFLKAIALIPLTYA